MTKLPAANGNLSVCGFCWGGTETFRYATNNKNLKAAYASTALAQPKRPKSPSINCPVYGFYGEENPHQPTIDGSKKLMADAKKTYEPVIYAGAGQVSCEAEKTPMGRRAIRRAARMAGYAGRNFSRRRRR